MQHAAFDDYAYELDLSRNVASKQRICDKAGDGALQKLTPHSLTLLGAPEEGNIYRSMPVCPNI